MWIAFKNYYLRDTKQLGSVTVALRYRCELLSKIIIFVTRNNHADEIHDRRRVVNCFQKLLSSWHETTNDQNDMFVLPLWIAFKNYYLRDTKQQQRKVDSSSLRCELLSKIIIFVTRNNHLLILEMLPTVVNCFQKLLSSWHETTKLFFYFLCSQLWIAFKNYYLRDTKQRFRRNHRHRLRCELLSKIIIFVTRNN